MTINIGDIIEFAIGAVIASVVLRWAYESIDEHWDGALSKHLRLSGTQEKSRRRPSAPKKLPKKRQVRISIKEEKVFHVNAPDGRNQIVVAADEKQALELGAKTLEVDEEDLVASEVYDKAVRK